MRTFKELDRDLLIRAYSGTSFSPEKRAKDYQSMHLSFIEAYYQEKKDRLSSTLIPEFEEWFDKFEEKYIQLVSAHLHAQSQCMSTMIAGPANFPVRSQEKKRATERRRMEDVDNFITKSNAAFNKKFFVSNIIKTSDEDAVERLEERIQKLEAYHVQLKAVNKIMRSKTIEDKVGALRELGLSDEDLQFAICKNGYGTYILSNNLQSIKYAKGSLEKIKRLKSQEKTEVEKDGMRIEDCPADNRIRLFFDGKPEADTRTLLKKNGFRWTPSLGCWQAYRNDKAFAFVKAL